MDASSSISPALDTTLRTQVALATKQHCDGASVTLLKREASSRSYYRVAVSGRSWVCMVLEKTALTSSDEASNGQVPTELPFVNVHRYLRELKIRVPDVLRVDLDAGVLVLEDLGPLTFEVALQKNDNVKLYEQAIDLLSQLRLGAEAHPDQHCIAFGRRFDEALYTWELHHFREWGMEAWSGKTPTEHERQQLDAHFADIAKRLAAAPVGFTHRDYQSRNIMVKDGTLVVIDFQDALLGPRQYDLVALLKDSYVELEPRLVDALLDRYISAVEKRTSTTIDRAEFKGFFHLLTVQRKAKDAARFEFIHRVKKNDGFLVSIPASLRAVRGAFEAQPQLSAFRSLVTQFVPALG
jgi:N-acetylmuramate 1-kinase